MCVGRLDNLAMSYLGLRALIDATSDAALAEEPAIKAVALFDHEEVGSASAQGALQSPPGPWSLPSCRTLIGIHEEAIITRIQRCKAVRKWREK